MKKQLDASSYTISRGTASWSSASFVDGYGLEGSSVSRALRS